VLVSGCRFLLVASNQSAIIADFEVEALAALGWHRTTYPANPPFGPAQIRPRLILLAFCVVASHGGASIFRLRLTTKAGDAIPHDLVTKSVTIAGVEGRQSILSGRHFYKFFAFPCNHET
jgi:hypothetical protein